MIRPMKILDGSLGVLLAKVLPGALSSGSPAELRNLLVIRPGGIGDAVLLIPALRALKQAFPAVRITVLAEKRNATVFDLTDAVAQVLLYHRPANLLAALKERHDAVIDTEQWHRLSAVIARLARAPVSVGFSTNQRKKMFTHTVDYSHKDTEKIGRAHV